MNPWHDLEVGKNAPKEITVVVEVPKDCKLKYELDKDSGMLMLDRALYSAVHYPGDYGFIPQTYWEDDDPMDVIILSNFPVYPMTIAKVRPIGVFEMHDGNERDDKIIAVHSGDPRFGRYKDLKDIPEHILLEVRHFFETYKALQNKKVTIVSAGGKQAAYKIIKESIQMYKDTFKDGKKISKKKKVVKKNVSKKKK